jgi:hypothetical protein
MSSHCRYRSTDKIAEPGIQVEHESREAAVKEAVTGIDMYKILKDYMNFNERDEL